MLLRRAAQQDLDPPLRRHVGDGDVLGHVERVVEATIEDGPDADRYELRKERGRRKPATHAAGPGLGNPHGVERGRHRRLGERFERGTRAAGKGDRSQA